MDVNGVEEDLCRVCRDGVSEGPLFHPCACSGSIRWVHEACLDGWLSVTGRSKCELCNETLHYTKGQFSLARRSPRLDCALALSPIRCRSR